MPRLMFIALLAIATPIAAEPPKAPATQPTPEPQRPVDLVLASADSAHSTQLATVQPSPDQTKHRIARVTTCRCGDPQPAADSQEQ